MRDYRDTLDGDQEARDVFLMALLEEGIYLMPDGRWYVSAALQAGHHPDHRHDAKSIRSA